MRLRRLVLGVAALIVAGVAVLAVRTVTGDHGAGTGHTTPPGSPGTTAPTEPSSFNVGIRTVTWVNPSGTALDPATGQRLARTLVTEIRYPTLEGSQSSETADASPATTWGPYPVVLFAHGYDVTPGTYRALLDHWVQAGFVVVAPLFPEENAHNIAALGGEATAAGNAAEEDLPNEPSDLAYVADQVVAWAGGTAPPASQAATATFLHGLADPSRLVIAGQSDGGDAVAGLVYGATYGGTYAAMQVHPRAVAILSGAEIPGVATTYSTPAAAPDLLVVQSNADQCNVPQDSAMLYNELGGSKWFLELNGVDHLDPYVGVGAAAPAVEQATTAFFRQAVGLGSATALGASVSGSAVATLTSGGTAPPMTPLQPAAQGAPIRTACGLPS